MGIENQNLLTTFSVPTMAAPPMRQSFTACLSKVVRFPLLRFSASIPWNSLCPRMSLQAPGEPPCLPCHLSRFLTDP